MKEQTVMVKTTDNWFPNYEGDQVALSLTKLQGYPITYRVCVWGMDDCGMERDFQTNDPTEAKKLFDKLKDAIVTMGYLSELGFISA